MSLLVVIQPQSVEMYNVSKVINFFSNNVLLISLIVTPQWRRNVSTIQTWTIRSYKNSKKVAVSAEHTKANCHIIAEVVTVL